MTISDGRLDRVWRTKVSPVVGAVDEWTDVTPHGPTSSWVAADADAPLVFERDRARLGDDLAATWRSNGREVLVPLAPLMQRLSRRVKPGDKAKRQISSTVYEMQ